MVSLVDTGADSSGANAATYEFDIDIGAANANKGVILDFYTRGTNNEQTLVAASIDGEPATPVVQITRQETGAIWDYHAQFFAQVSTAGIVTASVQVNANQLRAAISFGTAINIQPTAKIIAINTGTTPLSGNLTVNEGDIVFAGASGSSSALAGNATWAGVTEIADAVVGAEDSAYTAAAASNLVAEVNRAISVNWTAGTPSNTTLIAAVYEEIIEFDFTLEAEVGNFSLEGQDSEFLRNLILTADVGVFTLAGQDVVINYLASETGEFSINGGVAGFLVQDFTAGLVNFSGFIHNITYWRREGNDGEGGSLFAAPVVMQARWEERNELVHDELGQEFVSHSRVFVERVRLDVGGYLFLGTTLAADPTSVQGAYRIRNFIRTPGLAPGRDERKAIL
jgi:hypothetical protein